MTVEERIYRKIDNPDKGMLMRLVLTEGGNYVAHNCEHPSAQGGGKMLSWSGSAKEFSRSFQEADPSKYPKSAVV